MSHSLSSPPNSGPLLARHEALVSLRPGPGRVPPVLPFPSPPIDTHPALDLAQQSSHPTSSRFRLAEYSNLNLQSSGELKLSPRSCSHVSLQYGAGAVYPERLLILVSSGRKFGKQIQRRQLDLPEYAASFVNYKGLKKVGHGSPRWESRAWLIDSAPAYQATQRHSYYPRAKNCRGDCEGQ